MSGCIHGGAGQGGGSLVNAVTVELGSSGCPAQPPPVWWFSPICAWLGGVAG